MNPTGVDETTAQKAVFGPRNVSGGVLARAMIPERFDGADLLRLGETAREAFWRDALDPAGPYRMSDRPDHSVYFPVSS